MNDSEKSSSSSSLTPPSTPQPPQSAFERWRRKAALVTGIGVTEEERLADLAIHQTRHCEKTKTYLMNYSPIVVFMLKHLKLSGCEVPPENILCAPCDWSRAGGFTPDRGAVVLCSGHFFGQSHMESTLVHELMHMYDHCKFKVDWNNLRHHACSEFEWRLPIHPRTATGLRFFFEAASVAVASLSCVLNDFHFVANFSPNTPSFSLLRKYYAHDFKMFNKLSFLALATPLVNALTLNIPSNPTSGGSVTITWTSTATDPPFSLELNHPSFNSAIAIANNVQPGQGMITLTLPIVPSEAGYTLEAVNIGNINDVFSTTGSFAIAPNPDSSAPASSASTSAATGTSVLATASTTGSVIPKTSATSPVSSPAFGSTVSHSGSVTASGSASPSAQSNTASATTITNGASFNYKFGGNKGAMAAVLISALAGAAVVVL
ncbi:hypothetical protein C0989_001330 [Termitomyces sp. Mn162]|nr:hypothetical protein C0989_001330 [Termitomyces sp. Mn162]